MAPGHPVEVNRFEVGAMTDSVAPQQRHVHYEGSVQGVGFRYTTRRIASQFAVTGFVRNLSDGRVELVAEGAAHELDAFLAAIGEQMGGHVSDTRVVICPASGRFRQFEIRF
jgi:acylphosphatase